MQLIYFPAGFADLSPAVVIGHHLNAEGTQAFRTLNTARCLATDYRTMNPPRATKAEISAVILREILRLLDECLDQLALLRSNLTYNLRPGKWTYLDNPVGPDREDTSVPKMVLVPGIG